MVQRIFEEIFDEIIIKRSKVVIFIPLILFLILSSPLIINKIKKGYFIEKDVDITGGILIKVYSDVLPNTVFEKCEKFCQIREVYDITGKKSYEIIISEHNKDLFEELISILKKSVGEKNIVVVKTSGEVGRNIFNVLMITLFFAFILAFIITRFIFGSSLPALSISISTIMTVIDIIGLYHYLGIPISLVILGAILMIYGYSVDSDVVLGTYLYKRGGTLADRFKNAFSIVIMQEGTSFLVFLLMALLSINPTIRILALTLLFGIIFDLINTWLFSGQIQKIIIEKWQKI